MSRIVASMRTRVAAGVAVALAGTAVVAPPATALLGKQIALVDLRSPLADVVVSITTPSLPQLPTVPELPPLPELVPGELPEVPVISDLPVLGEIGESVEDVLQDTNGALDALDQLRSGVFTWETTYAPPNGGAPVVRAHQGVALAPQLLDVTGDAVPDVLATLTIGPDGRVGMQVARSVTSQGPLPLKAELVVQDTDGAGNGQRFRFGYDTLDSTAPATYDARIGITDGGSLSIDSAVSGPGAALTQAGRVVDLRGGDERDPQVARIRMAPVPLASHVGLRPADDETEVELSAASPTTVTVDADLTSGEVRTVARAVVDRLPGALTLALGETAAGRTLGYAASGPVASLRVGLEQQRAGTAVQRLDASLENLPTEIRLVQDGTRAAIDASGPIGVLDVAGSDGGPLRRLEDAQYAYLVGGGLSDTFALRILGLRSGEIDGGDAFSLRASSAGGRFRLLQEDGDARLEGVVADLPPSVLLAYEPSDQRLTYEGSDRIEALTLSARDPDGLQGSRATALDATLRDVPTALTIGLGAGGTIDLDARGGTLGSLDGLLTSGPAVTVPDGEDGVVLEDLPDRFAAAVRLTALRRATVAAGDAPSLLLDSTAGRRFSLRVLQGAEGEPVRRIEAAIDALRPNTRIGLVEDADGPRLRLSSDVPTDAVDLEAENLPGIDALDPRARLLRATLRGLPATLDLGLATDAAGGIGIDAGGGTLGLLEVLLTSGPDESLDPGTDGVRLTDTPEKYVVTARLTQLRSIAVATEPRPTLAIDTTAGRPFEAELVQQPDAATPAQRIRATIDALRPNTRVSYVDGNGAPELRFSADEPTGRVTLEGENVVAIGDRADRLRVRLEDLPRELVLGLSQTAGELVIDAGDERLGLLDVLATSGPEITVPDGADGLVLQDLDSHYAVAARLAGLREVRVALEPEPGVRLDLAGGRPFVASLDQRIPGQPGEVRTLRADIDMLKPATEIRYVTGDDGVQRLRFRSAEPTGEVRVAATNLGLVERADNLAVTLRGLPLALDLALAQADGEVSLDAGDQVLQFLELSLNDDLGPATLDPATDGLVLVDTPERYAAFARISGLRRVAVALDPAPEIELDTVARRPFRAELDTTDIPFGEPQQIRAAIDELKPGTRIGYDPGAPGVRPPAVSFAADEPTNAVDLDARNLTTLGGRARFLDLALRELPTTLTLELDQAAGALDIDAGGERLGLLEAQLSSDGVDRALDPSTDGLLLEDLDSHYAVFARLNGLNRARISLDPAPSVLLDLDGARPFTARLRQRDATTPGGEPSRLDVDIPRLERQTELRYVLDDAGPRFTFAAASRTQGLTVDAENIGGLSDRARNLDLRLLDIPTVLDLSLAQSSGRFDIDTQGDELGLFEVRLVDDETEVTLPAEVDGLKLVDTDDGYGLFGRITALRRVQVAIQPAPELLLDTGTRRPFRAEVDMAPDAGTGPDGEPLPRTGPVQTIRAAIDALQPNTTLRYADGDGGPSVAFSADAPTGEVTLAASNLAGLGDRATRIALTLRDLPQALELGLAGETGAVEIDARGQRLGFLEALLTSGPSATLPADRDGLQLVDTPSQFTLFGRITGLRRVSVETADVPDLFLDTDGGRPFDASLVQQPDGASQPQTITAELRDLQPNTRIRLDDTSGTQFTYSAAAPTNSLVLKAQGLQLGRANRVEVSLTGLPSSLDLDLAGDTGRIVLDTQGQTIGVLQALLTNGAAPSPAPAGEDGLVYVDTPTLYTVAARITGLRRIDAVTSPLPNLLLDSTGNKIFNIDLNTGSGPTTARINTLKRNTRITLAQASEGRELITYRADAQASSLNFSTNGLTASIANPVPTELDVCQAPGNACTPRGEGANSGSAAITANAHTTVNLAQEGLNATNLRLRRLVYQAQLESAVAGTSARGSLYLDTDNFTLDGLARIELGGTIRRINLDFDNLTAQDRFVTFGPPRTFGIERPGAPTRRSAAGSVTCNGTSISAELVILFTFNIDLRGILC